MKLKLNLFLLLLPLCFSCQSKLETVVVELPTLRASELFSAEKVNSYIQAYGEAHKKEAEAYVEKGESASDNPEKAVYFLKRALTLNPSYENYIRLGKLLIKQEKYKQAIPLYQLLVGRFYLHGTNSDATFLFQQPDKEIGYDFLICNFLHDGYIMWEDLPLNKEYYKERLLSDPRIQLDPSDVRFKNMMLKFLSDEELKAYENSDENFRNFIAAFTDSSRNFSVDANSVSKFNYHSQYQDEERGYSISHFYRKFIVEVQEGTNRWVVFDHNHLIKVNEQIYAATYAIDTSATACPKDMRHIYHRLVTYTNTGKIIDSKVVAYQAGEELATLEFNFPQFTTTYLKRHWKEPYDKREFDNYILKTDELKRESFLLTAQGKIEKQEDIVEGDIKE